MVNDIIFSKSFVFNLFRFTSYKYTDNTKGAKMNYLAYMINGAAKICAKDETVEINTGDLFFIPSGHKYESYWYGSPKIEFISLGFGFLPNFENKYYPTQVIKGCDDGIKLMHEIINSGTINSVTVGKFYTLVGMAMEKMSYKSQCKQSELIEKAKRLISDNPSLTVSELAKRCAVSESALYSAFKKHSDKSMNEIKKSVLMEKARELLISTDYPIEQISEELGFSSGAYFRKCFKESFGVSPREARKKFILFS